MLQKFYKTIVRIEYKTIKSYSVPEIHFFLLGFGIGNK